jgi:hypothetical protein
MDMGVQSEFLIPGVQHTEEADLRAQVSGVARNFQKRFRTGAKQQAIDDLLVLQRQGCQMRRKCEDHVHVVGREKFPATCSDPSFPRRGLTLRAVPIAARVVRDGAMPAAGALVEMTAQCGGTTPRNGQQHFDMLPTEPVAISFQESSSRGTDEIGHLQRWPVHLLL